MQNDDKKYEKAARYIDGEQIVLQDDERALVEDYCAQEETVPPALDAKMSPQLASRLRKKVHLVTRNLPKTTFKAFIVGCVIAAIFLAIILLVQSCREDVAEPVEGEIGMSVINKTLCGNYRNIY